MGEATAIEWTDHTFNPWTGCQHVSPGCDHCYAEAQAKRNTTTFGGWGPHAPRKRTSESYWRQPLKWNSEARKAGTRRRVFCASMADVFDNQAPEDWRADLWTLIAATPHLDWLLLTKRPQNIARMIPRPVIDWSNPDWPWPNVWLGTTVENQEELDRRAPLLLSVPARMYFLSCEPLLGPLQFGPWVGSGPGWVGGIDWVIAGGESGPNARPSHPDWHRSLRDQCAAAGVPFFFKQWGEWLPNCQDNGRISCGRHDFHRLDEDLACFRVGKKAAGALLDGREHREFPA